MSNDESEVRPGRSEPEPATANEQPEQAPGQAPERAREQAGAQGELAAQKGRPRRSKRAAPAPDDAQTPSDTPGEGLGEKLGEKPGEKPNERSRKRAAAKPAAKSAAESATESAAKAASSSAETSSGVSARGPAAKAARKSATKSAEKSAGTSAARSAVKPAVKPAVKQRGGLVVAVTGAAHGLGEVLARKLASSDAFKKVIGIDTIRGDVGDVTWRLADVREPVLADRLSGVDVVVHLAVTANAASERSDRRAASVRAAATVLTAAPAAGVRHVVLITSAMVYGAQPDNAVPMSEESELKATPDSALLGDLLEIERLARQAPRTHPGLAVTVLRPAALTGPGIDTVVTRHFEAPRLLSVKGQETSWQFCHVDDLLSAIELAASLAPDDASDGLVAAAVGCDGSLDRADVERITGKRHIELPAAVAFGTAERLHRIGATPASSSDLQFLVYPWVVRGRWLAAHGWRPTVSNEAALRAALAESAGRHAIGGHRLGRRDAAAGAAVGATVALVGTAALVRRARRRRHA